MRHTDFSTRKVAWWITGLALGAIFYIAYAVWVGLPSEPLPPPAPPPVLQSDLQPCTHVTSTRNVKVWNCQGEYFSQRKEKVK